MDALELLKQDHHKVKQLLAVHARIEETIFYPAVAEHEELKEMS